MTNPVGASLPGAAPNEPYASQKRHRDEAEREVKRRGFAEGKLQLLWRTPECFTRTYDMGEVIAAICEALTREGCTAWSGDGTSCVEQMIRLQWDRAVKAEAEVERLQAAREAADKCKGQLRRELAAELQCGAALEAGPSPRDHCQLCRGARGGVPGNENIVKLAGLNVTVCDYCDAALR